MVEKSEETRVRSQLMHMAEQCPSGRLVYELADGPLEPAMPVEIGVIKDGPYWVTGGEVTVTMSYGRELELRNRVTCADADNQGTSRSATERLRKSGSRTVKSVHDSIDDI